MHYGWLVNVVRIPPSWTRMHSRVGVIFAHRGSQFGDGVGGGSPHQILRFRAKLHLSVAFSIRSYNEALGYKRG